jgi:polar amino acid transport system substrate-binding protein
MKFILILFALISFVLTPITKAQVNITPINTNSQKKKVTLGVRKIEPFINEKDGKYSGFSMDIWQNLSTKLDIETESIKSYSNVTELLAAVEKKEVDVGIAAISITADREEKVDFSVPMFDSGLSVMTNQVNKVEPPTSIFNQIATSVFNFDFLQLGLWILLISFALANIIYFVEKRKKDGFLDNTNYFAGVTMSFWWGLTAVVGQQDRQPATKTGRFIGVIWMIFGVLFMSFFTAQITSNLTAQRLTGDITGIKDLYGKKVATLTGTTAAKYLKLNNYTYQETNTLDESVALLKSNEVDAIVYDKPALDYFIKTKGRGLYEIVGGKFTSENYGVALTTKSEYRKTINLELLKMQETGEYNTLKEKYFGVEN